MSAFPAQCRDGRTPHLEHEGTGSAAVDDPHRGTAAHASPRRALLGLSERQARRLYRAFRRDGADGSSRASAAGRARAGSRPATQAHALALIRERYS